MRQHSWHVERVMTKIPGQPRPEYGTVRPAGHFAHSLVPCVERSERVCPEACWYDDAVLYHDYSVDLGKVFTIFPVGS